MPADATATADTPANHSPELKRWALYLIKAATLVGLLYLLSRYVGMLPPLGIALVWAALSAFSAVGLTYHRVVRKTLKQHAYVEDGHLAQLNNGRILCLVVSFVVSAVCMAGLMLEVPTWDAAEWVLVGVAVPLYLVIFLVVRHFVRGEIKPAFRVSKAAAWSGVLLVVLLVALYGVVNLAQPAQMFASASEAFLQTPQPFENSPSALAKEAGTILALVDGFTAYGASRVAEVSAGAYWVVKLVLVVSALSGVASLLGVCLLEGPELKRVFLPLEAAIEPQSKRTVVKRNVITAIVLPVVLVGVYLGVDYATARAAQTEEYSAAQRFVRDQVDLAVFVLDGSYYEYQAVQEAVDEARFASARLADDAAATLVPLINASYDARIANVDSYLDWYYTLPADYERLVRMITGSVEEFAAQQFTEHIEAGIDDSALVAQLQEYLDQVSAIEAQLMERVADAEVVGVPDWLPVAKEQIDVDYLLDGLEPTQRLMSGGERLLVSAGAGVGAGALTGHLVTKTVTQEAVSTGAKVGAEALGKQVAEKAVQKSFFKTVVEKIGSLLGTRAISTVAGGAIGTAGGPLGVAAGIVAGGAVGVGVDYGLLKWDELWNREGYKEEIVQTIEDARAEMLAMVQ